MSLAYRIRPSPYTRSVEIFRLRTTKTPNTSTASPAVTSAAASDPWLLMIRNAPKMIPIQTVMESAALPVRHSCLES